MRTKEDIEYHQLGYGYQRVPAVNVKIHQPLAVAFRKWRRDNPDADSRFTEEWIDEVISDDLGQNIWFATCDIGWDDLNEYAQEIYDKHVKVYSEGRQGGWAYIDGINTDVESWDAIEFGRWRSFAKRARERADSIMWEVVDSIYHNYFLPWAEEQSELAAPDFPEGLDKLATL